MNQADIIFKLKKGDATVFKDVVSAWQNKVYNTAISIVQNEEDAEDITQEVFITLYERMEGFREESTLGTWIYKVTVSKSLDHEKRKTRQKRGGFIKNIFSTGKAEEPIHFNHPGVILDNKEKAAVLFDALKKLPEKQRIAFTLHKMEGLSYQQIAAVMNASLDAVESLQTRAKNNLRNMLTDYYRRHL